MRETAEVVVTGEKVVGILQANAYACIMAIRCPHAAAAHLASASIHALQTSLEGQNGPAYDPVLLILVAEEGLLSGKVCR